MRRRRRPVHVCVSIIQFPIMLFDRLDVPLTLYINYRPQRSCEGYVFTRVCHAVHRGGGGMISQHALQQGGGVCVCTIPACLAVGGVCSQGGACSRGRSALGGGVCSGGRVPAPGGHGDPPEADGYCCGRYASYWNAFLFNR